MRKLKNYKTFEELNIDLDYESEIDKVLENLIKQKTLVSMLRDTISHVCDRVEKSLPDSLEDFMGSLEHYEDDIFKRVDSIKDFMIDGYPNIKDMIEDVEGDIEYIENYIKNKKR